MVLKIGIDKMHMDKPGETGPVVLLFRSGKCYLISEVVKPFFQIQELFMIEHLFDRSGPVPKGDFAFAVDAFQLMEDVAAQRRHAGPAADKAHLFVRVLCHEIAVRPGDFDLVSGLKPEYERGTKSRRNAFGARRRRGNTDIELDNICFMGRVGHGIGPESGLMPLAARENRLYFHSLTYLLSMLNP